MKKLSRKILSVLLVVAMLVPTGSLMVHTSAETESIEIGDKITLGMYNGSPINWICVDIDENGPLMLAEDILCTKEYDAAGDNSTYHSDGWGYIRGKYGSNCWEDSNIRQWLNTSGTVSYTHCSPSYTDEKGFLSNFTSSELELIKNVTRIVNVNIWETKRDGYCDGGSSDTVKLAIPSDSFSPTKYYYKNISDSMFLINANQYNNIYKSNKQFLYASSAWLTCINVGNNYACYELLVSISKNSSSIASPDTGAYQSKGIRPAFYLDVDAWETEHLSENAKVYIQQHVDFVNSNTYDNFMKNASFYNAFWQYEEVDKNFTAYASWEIIGDIGEFMLGNLDDFFLTENPYDIILADVLASYVLNENTENACKKALEYVFKADSIYKDFLALIKSSSKWDDSIETNELTLFAKTLFNKTEQSLINGVFFSPSTSDVKKDYPEMYETVKKLFSGVSDSNFNKIFSGINNISTVTGYINTGADVVDGFMDAYQKYILAKTLVTTKSEVIGALLAACYQLENPIYQTALKTSIDSYIEVLDYDSAFGAVSNYMVGSSSLNVYNIFKGSLTDLVYSGIASIFGVAVDVVKKVIITYNVTYAFLDYFSGVGKESEMFFILNATAVLEKSLKDIVLSCGNQLINDNALDNATRFDAAYGLLQSVEQYAYGGLSKYISAMKKEFAFDYAIKSISGSFLVKYNAMKELNKKRASADIAIETAVFFEGEWKNANCHTGNFDKSKLVSVKCPTDVFVYNEKDELVLSIVNNRIEIIAANIAAIVDGNEKIFSIPCDREYDIKIVGTDKGTMNYSVYDSTDFETVNYTEFLDVPLVKDCVYSGNLETSGDKTKLDYSLSLECPHPDENHDGICDFCSEDFTKSCDCMCHSNAFLQFIHKIICFVYRLFGMNEYQFCDCGKAHW